jgi:hypothetical protein
MPIFYIMKILPLHPGTTFKRVVGSTGKNQMTRLLLSVLLIATLFGCKKRKSDYEEKIPAALQAVIDANTSCFCNPYIDKFTWKGNQTIYVYLVGFDSTTICDGIPAYYDKDGKPIESMTGKYDFPQFRNESEFIKTVWHCGEK